MVFKLSRFFHIPLTNHLQSTQQSRGTKAVIFLQWRTDGLQRPGANACIAPPPELAFPPGRKIDKQKKKRSSERKDPLMHRERGAHSIYATFARLKFAPTFKIRPYKLGRRPLQGLRPGAMAPPAPLGTPLSS